MEGSFDNDILIGNGKPNAMLGQPGRDRFYGNGGEDIVDARDGVQRLLDPVRRRRTAAKSRSGQGRQDRNARNPGHRPPRRPRPHRLLRPQPLQLRLRKTRHPVPGLNG